VLLRGSGGKERNASPEKKRNERTPSECDRHKAPSTRSEEDHVRHIPSIYTPRGKVKRRKGHTWKGRGGAFM